MATEKNQAKYKHALNLARQALKAVTEAETAAMAAAEGAEGVTTEVVHTALKTRQWAAALCVALRRHTDDNDSRLFDDTVDLHPKKTP